MTRTIRTGALSQLLPCADQEVRSYRLGAGRSDQAAARFAQLTGWTEPAADDARQSTARGPPGPQKWLGPMDAAIGPNHSHPVRNPRRGGKRTWN
jgi:hypothetical protein